MSFDLVADSCCGALLHETVVNLQHEELVLGEITFSAHDLGGHKAARRVWNTYYSSVDAIIYLVDATDERRLLETGEELNKILSTPELEKVPVLILGNKVDIAWALKPERLCSQFGLKLTGKQGKPRYTDERPLELFMCSIVRRAGYAAGMQWLAKQVKV